MARNKYPEETIKLILDKAQELFIQKGYDNTSIQDIINHLGGLSKGAIYHHFKSKEEIFESVCQRISRYNSIHYNKIRDDTTKNGYEKLKEMLIFSCTNPTNETMVAVISKLTSDPKFLSNQFTDINEIIVPLYIQPIIEQGVSDGSIQTAYPKELAEVIILLLNIWIAPILFKPSFNEMHRKLKFLSAILKGIGIPILDETLIDLCTEHANRYSTL